MTKIHDLSKHPVLNSITECSKFSINEKRLLDFSAMPELYKSIGARKSTPSIAA